MVCVTVRRLTWFVFLILASAVGLSADADARERQGASSASVAGVVTDGSGAVLADAVVDALVAQQTVATATTGEDGRYHLNVPAGVPLTLRVRRTGFADHAVTLTGTVGPIARDVRMQLGGVSDTLVVTASRGLEGRATMTQSVTVATRQDIQTQGATSLADVMRYVPGINVESNGREGAVASMFARGGESDYNLVLIDGVRANLSGGAFDFSRIGAAEIERVEVVRGAQSSLWGSDAMGSVIQIFTTRSGATDVPVASGSVERGSFGTWRSDARIGGGARRRVDYQAGITTRSSAGAFADLLSEDDRFDQKAFDGGMGALLGNRASVRGNLRYSSSNGRSVGPITFGSRDTGGVYDTKDLSGHVAVSHTLGSRFAGTASVNEFRYDNDSADTIADPAYRTYAVLAGTPNAIFPNGTRLVRLLSQSEFDAFVAAGAEPAPGQFLASRQSSDFPFTSLSKFERRAFRYQGDYTWGNGQRLSAGYEWEREVNPLTSGFTLSNHAVFVQQQFTWRDRWFATVGARIDDKQQYDTFVSPKLSVGGYLRPARDGALSSLKVFGNLGKGIKSPTFGERFGGSFADPSPNLAVEHARTGDIGVEATFASQRLLATATYFDNDYVDQIAFRSGVAGDGIPEYINIDGSKATGLELELALQQPVAGFTAMATYALVDNEVVTNVSTSQQFQPGQPLLRRPRHSGTIRVAYTIGRASVYANARIVGQRHDNSFLSLRTVPNASRPTAFTTDITVNPGYTVAGIGVDLRAHRWLTVFVRSDNVANAVYDSALGYPGLPRAIVAGARFNVGLR